MKEAIEKAVRTLESCSMTRFENGKAGRAVFTGHRLNAEDPTARLMRTGEWRLLRLSHKAVKDEIWDLGHRKYIRRRGELLRPDIFDEKTLARLEQTQVAPPYAYYYQQGASEKAAPIAKPGHFRNYCGELSPVQHVVMSIDPAQKGGDRSSYDAVQILAALPGNDTISNISGGNDAATGISKRRFWRFAINIARVRSSSKKPRMVRH